MSADNWAICPRCKSAADAVSVQRREEVERAYGRVAPEKYIEMLDNADAKDREGISPTFREDYQIGLTADGVFFVSYRGACECGAAFDYDYELLNAVKINPPKPTGKKAKVL